MNKWKIPKKPHECHECKKLLVYICGSDEIEGLSFNNDEPDTFYCFNSECKNDANKLFKGLKELWDKINIP